jgi:hypothetical protein
MSKADERHDITVNQYIDSLVDEQLKIDALELHSLMHKISGEDPILYGYGTIGFGVYKYHYESGRKGEAHTLAFYPRKGKITVYLMDGTARYSEHLTKLGKHSITGYCIYFKRLSDIDMVVLTQILEQSYQNITSLSKDKPIDHILWQI